MKHEVTSNLTKKLLADSLKKFMRTKPMQRITVSEIITDCGINRKTFYYHFADIYALLEWMFQEEAIKLLQDHDKVLTYEDGILLVLRYVAANREICLCALNSLGRDTLERFFYTDTSHVMQLIVEELSYGIQVNVKYKDFLSRFYTLALVSQLVFWLKSGLMEPPEELTNLIAITMHGNIRSALERAGSLF